MRRLCFHTIVLAVAFQWVSVVASHSTSTVTASGVGARPEANEPWCSYPIPFNRRSARLTNAAKAILDDLIVVLITNENLNVLLDVYVADPEPKRLRRARYEAVRRYITSKRFREYKPIDPKRVALYARKQPLCACHKENSDIGHVDVLGHTPTWSVEEYLKICCHPAAAPPN